MKLIRQMAPALAALAIMSISGCGARHSQKEVYYLVATNVSLPYWETAIAGFKAAAAQYNVTAKVAGPDTYDPQGELAEFQKVVAAKPAGILVSVSDAAVMQPGIDVAVSAGIPVITIDSDAAASHRLYFIGTNNLEAGRLGGRRVIAKLGGKGNVVFFNVCAGEPNTEERLKGFKDAFAMQSGINISEVIDIKGDASIAFDRTQALLARNRRQEDRRLCVPRLSVRQVGR